MMKNSLLTLLFLMISAFIFSQEHQYLSPETFMQVSILQLKKGQVERPAHYFLNSHFWDEAEKFNPGLLEQVKKIMALYFNPRKTRRKKGLPRQQWIQKGTDYDFIIGRNIVIHLKNPFLYQGVLIKEIYIKGAAFQKGEENLLYKKNNQRMPVDFRQYQDTTIPQLEFDKNGNTYVEHEYLDRWLAMRFSVTSIEYDISSAIFNLLGQDSAPIPVINLRYDTLKDHDDRQLGAIALASPLLTIPASLPSAYQGSQEPFKNRLMFYVTYLYTQCHIFIINQQPTNAKQMMDHACGLVEDAANQLRKIHDAGFTHGNPHPQNFIHDPQEDRMMLVDFAEGKRKSEMSPLMILGYQTRDLLYLIANLKKQAESIFASDIQQAFYRRLVEHVIIKYFRMTYPEFDANQDQIWDDLEYIMQQLINLEERSSTPINIFSVLSHTQLGRKLIDIVLVDEQTKLSLYERELSKLTSIHQAA